MKVYGFVGPSGTGKSYRVTELARKHRIPLIIDDGLLIRGNTAIAGVSAKKEKTKFASVKRALFFEREHAENVRRAIAESGAEKIILVGTSVEMVQRIATMLLLPPPEKIIHINDVSSEEDIRLARHIRQTEGKHVIPVPTFQIRKDFSGYWLDPLQIFRPANRKKESEKTLVRPTYSCLGEFTISHSVVVTICIQETKKFPEVTQIWICSAEEQDRNLILHLEINLRYGESIPSATEKIRKHLAATVTEFTGIWVEDVKIAVRSLDIK
ncbi:MAG: Asp23/Gls24 family envelope stress response protein [Clostridia bacterium]|nr:Asp23/Gls24 family envelope stress response protein [Clostridia bacterium]